MFPKGIILLDLRRMNHIIEINEKNMYAVVEPYVISAELQAELMKRGLNFCIKGAGTNCSAMLRGHGHMDQTTSGDDRNHLAIEWVTPEGDIVRSGSLGSSDEWFCGDGPGPSLRSHTYQRRAAGRNTGSIYQSCREALSLAGACRFPVVGQIAEIYLERDTGEHDGAVLQLPVGRENVAGGAQDRRKRNSIRADGF